MNAEIHYHKLRGKQKWKFERKLEAKAAAADADVKAEYRQQIEEFHSKKEEAQ
jgi:hypothetical protein